MIHRWLAAGAAAAAAGALFPLGASSASAKGAVPLVGTFKLTAGACDPVSGVVSGSWFRLIFPHGNTTSGFFFQNSSSTCFDRGYTTISPGTQGGLVTGRFQPGPQRAFDKNGNARATAIIRPVPFGAIGLSLSTESTDPQTRSTVSVPVVMDKSGRLSGNLEAISATWRRVFINQGSPKPRGRRPGLTQPVSGTYNARTRAFVLTWTSQIVGGPFTGFIGSWHLVGKFVASN